jgi:hypothetical protein
MLGVWLMAAPALLGLGQPATDVLHIIGPIAASVGFVAASEVTRGLRWLNVLTGVALVVTPLALSFAPTALLVSLCTGLALIGLAFRGGRTATRFGGGWRALFR